jgi:hypothetical protein
LIVIESAEAAAAFKRAFGGRFCRWRGSVGCDAVAAPSWHRDYGANCPPLSALIHPSAIGKWVMFQFEFLLPTDTVEKLDFLPRSQFLRQQAGFKKKALRVRQKG